MLISSTTLAQLIPPTEENPRVVRVGNKLEGFYGVDEKLQSIWMQVKKLVGLPMDHPAPWIYLQSFEEDKMDPEFREWQKEWTRTNYDIWADWFDAPEVKITPQWIDQNIDEIYPFPKVFLAFHYDGTQVIQINPYRTFYKFYQVNAYGVKQDFVGFGYYSAAHEMLHYGLEQAGVRPTQLHHCFFLRPSTANAKPIMERLADFLIDEGISDASVKHFGLEPERSFTPCLKLSESELKRVDELLQGLPR